MISVVQPSCFPDEKTDPKKLNDVATKTKMLIA